MKSKYIAASMNKDFNTKEICAICGHRLGVHKAEDYSCPKDIGRAGEFLETKFTRITPTTEQTELWKEIEQVKTFYQSKITHALNMGGMGLVENLKEQMHNAIAEKYSITRKEEVPEAVEFAEWCVEFYGWSDTDELWVDNQGEKYTTAELFQLFKTPT